MDIDIESMFIAIMYGKWKVKYGVVKIKHLKSEYRLCLLKNVLTFKVC